MNPFLVDSLTNFLSCACTVNISHITYFYGSYGSIKGVNEKHKDNKQNLKMNLYQKFYASLSCEYILHSNEQMRACHVAFVYVDLDFFFLGNIHVVIELDLIL